MSESIGFDLRTSVDGLVELNVTGAWTDEAALTLASGQAQSLVLNYARGFRERRLDFLDCWPIRRLEILARTLHDIEPVYRLGDTLEELGLTVASEVRLELARLPRLRHFWGPAEAVADSLRRAPLLRRLGVGDVRDEDLSAFSSLIELEELRVRQVRRLKSVDGIEHLARLRSISIAAAPSLSDLAALRSPTLSLQTLRLNSCGGITRLDDIASHRLLRVLHVANCGPIESIKPLRNLTYLEVLHLYESTRISDGDLAPLLNLANLKDLRITNRKHYAPSVQAVQTKLGLTG